MGMRFDIKAWCLGGNIKQCVDMGIFRVTHEVFARFEKPIKREKDHGYLRLWC